MKSKFGVITFAPEQIKSEEIVLRGPDFSMIENSLRESRKTIKLGGKMITGFLIATAALIAAGIFVKQPKPIPVKIGKRSSK